MSDIKTASEQSDGYENDWEETHDE